MGILGIPNWVIVGFLKKIFLNFGLKSVIEKCDRCFLVYLFLEVFLIKKVQKVGCECNSIKTRIDTLFKCVLIFERETK